MPASTSDTDRRRIWLALAVALATLAAYLPALRGGWIWDDDSYVTANALIQSPSGLAAIWGLSRDAATGALVSNTPQYYPFVFTSFWVEHALFGLEPFVFHLTNVLLHLANAWLLWRVLAKLGMPGAGFAAALFALHPMHVESVAWVTERKNVMSGAFYLLAFLAYLRFDDERRPRWWILAFLAFVAALLSKSVTATLPIVLGVAVFWRRGRLGWKEIAPLLPFLVLGTFSGWFTAWLEVVKVGARGREFDLTFADRALHVAPRAWWHYVRTAWFPHPVMFVYPRWDPESGGAWRLAAPVGVVALVAALFAAQRKTGWAPILLVFTSAITLAPALGFVAVYPHRYSWVADHFAYLGSAPLVALLVLAAREVGRAIPAAQRGAAGIVVAVAALAACALLVFREARSYAGARALWEATLVENPHASLAQVSLGIELMQDPRATPADAQRAYDLFEAATHDPNLADQAHSNLGQWRLVRGELEAAIREYEAALRADPNHARARAGLREAWWRLASAPGAPAVRIERLRAARAAVPDDARLAQLEAWILATADDPAVRDPRRARGIAEALVARDARDAGLLDTLAATCAAGGDFAAAVRHAEDALRRAPPAARAAMESRLALYRRGAAYVEPSVR